jgi:SEFIR domain
MRWRQTVLDFATALRRIGGIDADLDLWHTADHTNWSTFGVSGIRDSDFVLIAVSSAYRERWEETGSPREGAGAAREANAIKAIFNRDRAEFGRRVKVILLPGATVDDIPFELVASAEHFPIERFDVDGLTALLRSLHGKPELRRPPLGRVPALPPSYVAGVAAAASVEGAAPVGISSDQSSASDRADVEALQRRLSQIDETLNSPDHDAQPCVRPYEQELLVAQREVIAGSLNAVQHLSLEGVAIASAQPATDPGKQNVKRAMQSARDAIAEAQQAVQRLPPIVREALFQYAHNAQPVTVGGTLDRFTVEEAIRREEEGYLNWVEDAEQTVSARQANPRVGAAATALLRVRSLAFGGVSWESRAQAAPWARSLLRDEFGIDDPEFELRPVWVKLGLIDE